MAKSGMLEMQHNYELLKAMKESSISEFSKEGLKGTGASFAKVG